MSDELQRLDKEVANRSATAEQFDVVGHLLDSLTEAKLRSSLKDQLSQMDVQSMSDGNMGSFLFVNKSIRGERKFGKAIVEAEFNDVDDVLVTLVLNLDTDGRLYELDVWKTDFSDLKKWPSKKELRVTVT